MKSRELVKDNTYIRNFYESIIFNKFESYCKKRNEKNLESLDSHNDFALYLEVAKINKIKYFKQHF